MTLHYLDDSQPHAFWDKTHPPRIRIQPGEIVVFETLEGTGQITSESDASVLANLEPSLIHPLTGPVYVEGAEPGDVLKIEVLSLEHKGWGWNGVIPGFGLLGDEFPTPYIHHYALAGEDCIFDADIRIPYEPFCGIMGVAPTDSGRLDTWPPRANAGNMDVRHLTPGAIVRMPVLVPGALFSCGDCHAAQGDGEINGTGIESPMRVTLRLGLGKEERIPELQFITPAGRKLTRADEDGYFVTTAHGPDLFEDARMAVRYMLDHLVTDRGLTREQAYCLCGAAVDLKINEVVNEPNWIVSAYLPLVIFAS
ncbi:MAG: acetamidase/formamidase family protein [Actinomycetota bacterium]|nr:acetamidase/formamidase family protein [Actinomycetota bacterium]